MTDVPYDHRTVTRDPTTGRVPPHPLDTRDPTTIPQWPIGSFGAKSEVDDDKRGVSEVERRLLELVERHYKELQKLDRTHRGSRAWGEALCGTRGAHDALKQIGHCQGMNGGYLEETSMSTERGRHLASDWQARLY
jgi:hypothetical protein